MFWPDCFRPRANLILVNNAATDVKEEQAAREAANLFCIESTADRIVGEGLCQAELLQLEGDRWPQVEQAQRYRIVAQLQAIDLF